MHLSPVQAVSGEHALTRILAVHHHGVDGAQRLMGAAGFDAAALQWIVDGETTGGPAGLRRSERGTVSHWKWTMSRRLAPVATHVAPWEASC